MSEERILVVVPRVYLDGVTRTVGDLVFTNRQVFLARRTGRADPARVPDVAPATPRRKSATQKAQARPLDTILAKADPRTRFEYRELESITVKLGGLFSSPTVSFVPHHGRRLKLSGKQSALQLLASAIPVLAGVGAPISLS